MIYNVIAIKMELRCRADHCNKKLLSYRGRLDHERSKHGGLKKDLFNCGRRTHKHTTFNGAKQCRYRRNLRKKNRER